PRHDTLGGRLRGSDGFELQLAAPGSGGHGRWHALCGHPAKTLDRGDDRRRAAAALDGEGLERKDEMDATEATLIPAPALTSRIGRKIGLAWLALAWEGIWPRLMPILAVLALFVAAAHLDLFAGLDPWVHTGILAALGLALAAFAWWRFRSFSWPPR